MKKLITIIAAIALICAFAPTAYADWQEKDGERYWYNSDGNAASGFKNIEDTGYIFDSDGRLVKKYTGFTNSTLGRRYYRDGEIVKNVWLKVGGVRKYFAGEDGYLLTGWQLLKDGFFYKFDEKGAVIDTTRPKFCKTDSQAAEYARLRSVYAVVCDMIENTEADYGASDAEVVMHEDGIIVGEDDGKDVKMIVEIWADADEAVKKITDELERLKFDKDLYRITVGKRPMENTVSEFKIYDEDGIVVTAEYSGKYISVTLENKTDADIAYSEGAVLEIKNDGEWYTLARKRDPFRIEKVPTLPANSSLTFKVYPKESGYAPFEAGEYRAIVTVIKKDGFKGYIASTEFQIYSRGE